MPLSDIITPDFVRNAVLPSVRFVGRDNKPIDDDYFYQEIDGAISMVEGRTSLALSVDHRKLFEERKDNLDWHDETWFLKKTLKRPIQSIYRFGFVYGNFPTDYLPADWLLASSYKMGQVQIVPGPTGLYMNTYNLWFPDAWTSGQPYLAGGIKVDYYAGFDKALTGTHTATTSSTTVTITGATDQALDFQPGMWVKLGSQVRRIAAVIDGSSYRITNPVKTNYAGAAILLQYPPLVIKAVSAIAGASMLALAESLLSGGPGLIGKGLAMDGMSQSKAFNKNGPYATWRNQLNDVAEQAMIALHSEYAPVRIIVV